jgi:hypothetical protein
MYTLAGGINIIYNIQILKNKNKVQGKQVRCPIIDFINGRPMTMSSVPEGFL